MFDEFLNIIGTKIALKDWDKFRGGLDVKSNEREKDLFLGVFK